MSISGIVTKAYNIAFSNWHFSNKWSRTSYSQEGEDLALSNALDGISSGFYVEVGAHHPFRFSNTYLFYKRGWRGICVDPLPGSKKLFELYRPNDIYLECGVAERKSELTYYMFNEPALNTFNETVAREKDGLRDYKIINRKKVDTFPLSEILDQYVPEGINITFFSIDVEGIDLEVLASNNWEKYKPKIVVAECLKTDLLSIPDDPVVKYLWDLGYMPQIKTGNSVIFFLLVGSCV